MVSSLLRKLAGLAVVAAGRYPPEELHFSGARLLENLDADTPLFRKVVDWQSRKYRLGSDDVEGCRLSGWYGHRQAALPSFLVVHLHFFF